LRGIHHTGLRQLQGKGKAVPVPCLDAVEKREMYHLYRESNSDSFIVHLIAYRYNDRLEPTPSDTSCEADIGTSLVSSQSNEINVGAML
jgi:hypothetical protein